MLIEVTCIKWNLIGTDTGSLTDRHDADGLRGGKGGARETGKERGNAERRGETCSRREAAQRQMKDTTLLLYVAIQKREAYDTKQRKKKKNQRDLSSSRITETKTLPLGPSHVCLMIGG